ncbi:hypothetical protein JG688_00010281 [Phytophthora aleatoria]|uniref:Uncharacterized protein n=1 Tax=Phytophthora aleatoria TaxID=2496075 RepID=A0A8J5M3G0_9STRA|nr:hypothetical protein JG688_00010281 [Phytophthora aleatoria]
MYSTVHVAAPELRHLTHLAPRLGDPFGPVLLRTRTSLAPAPSKTTLANELEWDQSTAHRDSLDSASVLTGNADSRLEATSSVANENFRVDASSRDASTGTVLGFAIKDADKSSNHFASDPYKL